MAKRKVALKVEVLDPEEFSEEAVEAFIRAVKGRGRFYTVEELGKLSRKEEG